MASNRLTMHTPEGLYPKRPRGHERHPHDKASTDFSLSLHTQHFIIPQSHSRPVVPNQEWLCSWSYHQGDIWPVWRQLWSSLFGVWCDTGFKAVETKATAHDSTIHRAVPTTENDLAPNVKRSDIDKLSSGSRPQISRPFFTTGYIPNDH